MTPTREQVVHLGRKAGIFPESKFLMPYDYIIDAQTKFATLARADLEATIAEQAAEIERLTRQRDELLAAIADHIGSIDPESENRAYDDLRSAYDRAKGGAV